MILIVINQITRNPGARSLGLLSLFRKETNGHLLVLVRLGVHHHLTRMPDTIGSSGCSAGVCMHLGTCVRAHTVMRVYQEICIYLRKIKQSDGPYRHVHQRHCVPYISRVLCACMQYWCVRFEGSLKLESEHKEQASIIRTTLPCPVEGCPSLVQFCLRPHIGFPP